jgi:hypothetical protein
MKEAINEKNFDEFLEGTDMTGWKAFKLAIYVHSTQLQTVV